MERSEAISAVLGYISQIDGEWGDGRGDTTSEEIEVLTALGVTQDELIAHNVIKAGLYYERILKLAGIAASDAPSGHVLAEVRRELATLMDMRDPAQNDLRTKLFDLTRPRV